MVRKIRAKLVLISTLSLLLLSIPGCQQAIEKTINTPQVHLYVSIDGLSSSGLDVSIDATITNPNPITLEIGDLEVTAKGETGHTYLHDTIMGGSIAPNSSKTFAHSALIPFDVLNERNITVTADTRAGVAGIALPFGATATIGIPDLASLISVPQLHVYVSTSKLRLPPAPPSIEVPTTTTVTNDNDVGLILGDLHMNLYKSGGQLVITDTAPGGVIPAHSTRTVEHSIILGLEVLNIIGSSSVTLEVDTEVGISGINEMVSIQGQFTLELPPLPPFPPWP